MNGSPINVLVVDDSTVSRMFVVHVLKTDPDLRVIGAVSSGLAALDFVKTSKPDVVVMDIHMPDMDGFETTRRIMETRPVPIVICSATTNPQELVNSFRMLEAGAVACVAKPRGLEHADYAEHAAQLVQTVKLMSEVKVVRRWARSGATSTTLPAVDSRPERDSMFVVGIGTSTGGPPILQTILAGLPKDFPAPVLIVQHISPGFLLGLAEWLSHTSSLPIHIGSQNILPLPGHVYLAPDSFQMSLNASGRIQLSQDMGKNGQRPSVSYLFHSLAEVCGPRAVGVLLTGMGKDGAAELKEMRDKGAVTIAQDQDSSVIHGMPGEAIALGGATHVLSADQIVDMLVSVISRGRVKGENTI